MQTPLRNLSFQNQVGCNSCCFRSKNSAKNRLRCLKKVHARVELRINLTREVISTTYSRIVNTAVVNNTIPDPGKCQMKTNLKTSITNGNWIRLRDFTTLSAAIYSQIHPSTSSGKPSNAKRTYTKLITATKGKTNNEIEEETR